MNLFVVLCLFSTIALINVSPIDSTFGDEEAAVDKEMTEATTEEDDATSTTEGAAEEEMDPIAENKTNTNKQLEYRLEEIEAKLGDLKDWQEDMTKEIMQQLKTIREANKRAREQQGKDMENKIKQLKTISEDNKRTITQQEEDFKKMTAFNCLQGWEKLEFGCFLIYPAHDKWSNISQVCEENGGFLAETRSQSELDAVVKLLFANPNLPQDEFYWLGGSDEAIEGHWKWVRTGENVTQPDGFGKIKSSPWKSGKPDKHDGKKHCLALQSDGTWEDMVCEIQARGLCQLGKTSPKTCPYALPLH